MASVYGGRLTTPPTTFSAEHREPGFCLIVEKTVGKRKQPALKVSITYSPPPDYRERLRKVVALLLRPPNPAVNKEIENAEMENRTTH